MPRLFQSPPATAASRQTCRGASPAGAGEDDLEGVLRAVGGRDARAGEEEAGVEQPAGQHLGVLAPRDADDDEVLAAFGREASGKVEDRRPREAACGPRFRAVDVDRRRAVEAAEEESDALVLAKRRLRRLDARTEAFAPRARARSWNNWFRKKPGLVLFPSPFLYRG